MTKEEKKQRAAERQAQHVATLEQFPPAAMLDYSKKLDEYIQVWCEGGRALKRLTIRFKGNHFEREENGSEVWTAYVRFTPEEALEMIHALTARYNYWVSQQNAIAVKCSVEMLTPISRPIPSVAGQSLDG